MAHALVGDKIRQHLLADTLKQPARPDRLLHNRRLAAAQPHLFHPVRPVSRRHHSVPPFRRCPTPHNASIHSSAVRRPYRTRHAQPERTYRGNVPVPSVPPSAGHEDVPGSPSEVAPGHSSHVCSALMRHKVTPGELRFATTLAGSSRRPNTTTRSRSTCQALSASAAGCGGQHYRATRGTGTEKSPDTEQQFSKSYLYSYINTEFINEIE